MKEPESSLATIAEPEKKASPGQNPTQGFVLAENPVDTTVSGSVDTVATAPNNPVDTTVGGSVDTVATAPNNPVDTAAKKNSGQPEPLPYQEDKSGVSTGGTPPSTGGKIDSATAVDEPVPPVEKPDRKVLNFPARAAGHWHVDDVKASKGTWAFRIRWIEGRKKGSPTTVLRVSDQTHERIRNGNYDKFKRDIIRSFEAQNKETVPANYKTR